MKKIHTIPFLFVCLVILSSYCFASGTAETSVPLSERAGVLRVCSPSEPGSLDPVFGGSPVTTSVVMAVYETPAGYLTEERGEYSIQSADDVNSWRPLLAEKIDISEDRQVLTFSLRRNVRFYPSGNEMTSDDWIWSWSRQLSDPPLGWGRFENQQAGITSIEQIKKVDDYTIQIHLDGPNSLALPFMRFQMFAVYDSQEAEKHVTSDDPWASMWLSRNTAGTGPYFVDEWSAGEKIVLKANPFYWGDVPEYTEVVIDIVPEESTRLSLLAQGDVMLVNDIAPELAESFAQKDGIDMLSIPSGNRVYIGFNSQKGAFSSKDLRKAVAYAVPYDSILNGVYKGCGQRYRSFVHPELEAYTPDGFDYETDINKAGLLIRKADISGPVPVLYVNAGSVLEMQTASLLQENLLKCGLEIEIKALPSGEFTSRLFSKDLDFFITSGVSWIDDPATITGLWMVSGAYGNYTGFSNAEVDKIQESWQFSIPSNERNEAYKRAQKLYNEDVNVIYLLMEDKLILHRSEVSNYTYYKDTAMRYQDLKITD